MGSVVHSQDIIQIDPRQYVLVQYRKLLTREKLDTLWNWEKRPGIPNQKIQYVDVDGEVRIDFSKTGFINNKEFEGVVSLEAEISGANGTRKIEVNPYSEVGVQRIPIGIKSEAPTEIARKLLNMISTVRDADSIVNNGAYYRWYTIDGFKVKRNVDAQAKKIFTMFSQKKVNIADIKEAAINLRRATRNEISNFYYDDRENFSKKIDSTINAANNTKQLMNAVTTMVEIYNYQYEEDRRNYNNYFKESLKYAIENTDLILDYLSSFENAGEDAAKTFFLLINKDFVNYKALKSSFINYQKKLSQINVVFNKEDTRLDSTLSSNADLIMATIKSLSELSRFKGSPFEKILLEVANEKNDVFDRSKYKVQPSSRSNVSQPESATITNNNAANVTQQDLEKKRYYFDLIDKNLQYISEKLSTVAGVTIYKKLIYATIDLGKSGAKNGEVLNVYLTWILNSKRDSLSNSPRLSIGKYYLRETGWRGEISDMFSLVKRSNEQNMNLNSATVSPSNFKGSGGAVLMWTFNKEDKGLVITKNTQGEYMVKRRNRFSNFLEPSIGLNVSYLDFSTGKDVEIGIGLQLGLFRNKIFFGYGINLHLLSPKNQSPNYFFIGFSFAKLSDLFKTNNNVVASQ